MKGLVEEENKERLLFCQKFNEAFEAYHKNDTDTARRLFVQLHEQLNTDYPTQLYLDRIETLKNKTT